MSFYFMPIFISDSWDRETKLLAYLGGGSKSWTIGENESDINFFK